MNKTKLKNYAPKARQSFRRIVRERADLLGLTKKEIDTPKVQGDVAKIEGNAYPKSFANMHQKLAKTIETEGLESLIERVAYSWFNRFAAIRFMEVNGFLSHSYRVLSNRDETKNEPEILEHAAEAELLGLDKEKVINLKLAGNKDAELYKLLLIAQCNELHRAMPFLFERINDETELLLPDNLLHTDSVIRKMVSEIEDDDWHNVEIIGWLYQFYISERKDEVIGKTVKSEDIPAATQLFTPNWIVKYMTQNSLGRLWLEANPNSTLAEQMEFYIKSGTSDEGQGISEENDSLVPRPSSLNPEEITILDPACGSGHILVEAYDLLKAIYLERGYRQRDIPMIILEKNLFGLDIDKRAVQLASFALLMKARNDDRRIFEKLNDSDELKVQNSKFKIPQIYEIPDSSELDKTPQEIAAVFFGDNKNGDAIPLRDNKLLFSEMETQPSLMQSSESEDQISEQNIIDLFELFENGKTFGSLIRIPNGFEKVIDKLSVFVSEKLKSNLNWEFENAPKLIPFIQAAQILARKYDAVIANPPYMGGKGMNATLKDFAKREFPESKSDLFAMFIERGFELAEKKGFNAMVTMQSWMFLSSYVKLRESLLDEKTIITMAHLGARAFTEISGEVVQTTAFVMTNEHHGDYQPTFFRLIEGNEAEKRSKLRNGENRFDKTKQKDFKKIPGSPIAYWVSDKEKELYVEGKILSQFADPRKGIDTGENAIFLRYWFEPSISKLNFDSRNGNFQNKGKWFPYNKGGEYRRWYGNREYVVNWENDGERIRNNIKKNKNKPTLRNLGYRFREGFAWSTVSSSGFSSRYCPNGAMFDNGGCTLFAEKDLPLVGALTNSKIGSRYLEFLSPTLNFQPGDISRILYISPDSNSQNKIILNTEQAVSIARADWDSFETSWDFSRLPILDFGFWNEEKGKTPASVEETFRFWEELTEERIRRMQELETENNRLFIEAYGLEDELEPEVPREQITLARADRAGDTKSLLSYFVGCAMGRYSLDAPGLIYADAGNKGFDASRYKTFPADEDGIIPVTDMEWFPQEAATRFADFIEKAFGNSHHRGTEDTENFGQEENKNNSENSVLLRASVVKNLDWIAEGLGKRANETPLEAIRRYFSKDFFKDHIKTYKKRPIYWLFSSGKEKAFEALVYLHRYNEQTLARMRQEYVLPLMSKLEANIETLAGRADDYGQRSGGLIDTAESTSEKTKLTKQLEILNKKQVELKHFDENLRHYSDMRITIDLDDGVKENYAKFGELVAMGKQISPVKKK